MLSVAHLQDNATRRYVAALHRQRRAHLVAEVAAVSAAARRLAAEYGRAAAAAECASVAFAHPVHNPVENHSGVIRVSPTEPDDFHLRSHVARGELVCRCYTEPTR